MVLFNEQDNFLIPAEKSRIKAALFVAHPDDETIWMGGTILSKRNWNWKIFVATHKESDYRGQEFVHALQKYAMQPGSNTVKFQFIEVMKDNQQPSKVDKKYAYDKLDTIKVDDYDIVFTHNSDGEYSHINHTILGEYFIEKRKDGLNVWNFLCPAIQVPRRKHVGEYVESVCLNKEILETKCFIFQSSYVTQQSLWTSCSDFMRFQFCSGVEMFTRY